MKRKENEVEFKENWKILMKKMEDLGLDNSEKEIIKHDIIHKDAERLREKY